MRILLILSISFTVGLLLPQVAFGQTHNYYTFTISGESNVCIGVNYTYSCPYPATWNVGTGGEIMGGSAGSIVVRWNSYDGMSISATYSYQDPPNCWYEPDVVPPVLVCDPFVYHHYSSNPFPLNPAVQTYGLTGGNGCVGSSVSVRLTGSQVGVTYQLRRGGVNIGSAVNGTGGEINFGNQTVAGNYVVIGTRTSGGCSVQVGSSNVVLFASVGGTLNGAITVCGGASDRVFLSGHDGNVFSWERNTGSGWSAVTTNASSEYYYSVSQPTRFRALVFNNGCPGVYSTEALIDASPATVGGALSGGGVFCNTATGTLVLSGQTGAVARWEVFNGSTWNAISDTNTTLSFSGIGSERRYRAIVKSGSCTEVPSAEALIQVFPSAVQALTISSNKTAVCPGEGIQFQVSSESAIGSSPTYQWFVNGVPRTSDAPAGAKVLVINNWNYATNSVVTCRVTSSLPPCATNNPAMSNGISISVNASQAFSVGMSVLPSRNPMTYCPGEISFQANPSHATTSVSWFKNGVSVGSGLTYTPVEFVASDVVSVTATANGTCLLNTQATASTSGIPITIKSLVSVGAIGCDICAVANRCQGSGSTAFSALIQNQDAAIWTLENAGNSSINAASGLVTWAPDFSGTATIRVTATGCGGPISTTRAISVTPSGGAVAVSISSNKSSVCPGEGIQFQVASEANVGSSPSYQWFVNGNPRTSDVGVDPKVLIINNWSYSHNSTVTCRVTSSTACTTNNPAISNTVTIGVNALQPFSVGVSILPNKSPLTYCADEISFQANPSHPVSGYAWTVNGNPTILSATQNFDPVSFAQGDWVSVTAYAANGTCLASNMATGTTQGVPVTIYTSLSGVSLTTTDGGRRCQGGGTTQFSITGSVPSPFQWVISAGGNSTINSSGLVTWDPTFSGTAQIGIRLLPCPSISITRSYQVIAPATPVANQASGISATAFTASWAAATCAASYLLDVSTVSNFASFVVGFNALPVSGTSQLVSGLAPGTAYFYRVRSVFGSLVSTNSVTIQATTLPQTPVAKAPTSVLLSSFIANWDPVTGATGYRIDVSTVNTFTTFVSGYNNLAVAGTSQSITGLPAGTIYYYRVRATNASGTSSNSNTISALTLPTNPTAGPATAINSNSFNATWSAVLSATEYRLDISSVNTFANFLPGYNNLQVAGTSRSVTGLAAGTTYFYRVRAVNGSGVSTNSPTVTVLTLPAAPVALPATAPTTTSFTAGWNTSVSASSYRLDVSLANNFSSFLPGFNNLLVTGTSQVVSILTPGTIYYYRVRAVNGTGTSSNSSAITAITLPAAPVAQNATSITSNSFRANWNPSAGATEYRLDVSINLDFSSVVSGYSNLLVSTTNQLVTPLAVKEATYYYRVRAINGAGASTNSNVIVAVALDRNYVRTSEILIPNVINASQIDGLSVGQKSASTSFVDGLGRPVQQVLWQQSPNGNDLVQPIVYDPFGREAAKYLPYAAGNDGWLKPDFLGIEAADYSSASSPHYSFYQNTTRVAVDSKPFAVAIFENSPLNRVIEQGSTGQAWQPDGVHGYSSSDRTIKKSFEFNLANEVLLWTYSAASGAFPFGRVNAGTAAAPVFYPVNQLIKTRTKDEQYNEVIEFVDKQGQVVLKRVQVNATQYASTYYIYDDLGQLVCVIPPEAVNRLNTEYFHASATDATKDAFLRRWAFRYRYDHRRRMILKKVPGADSVRMVYDNRDRLILTQDGNQRAGAPNTIKYWSFTKYDELNRPVLTGIKDTTVASATVHMTQAQMQAIVNAHFAKASARWGETYIGNAVGNVHGYTNKAYPVRTGSTTTEVNPDKYLTVTYYDNYAFRSTWGDSFRYLYENLTTASHGVTYSQPATENPNVVGQVTGQKDKVLDGINQHWIQTVNYFDDKYRLLQKVESNYKDGITRVSNLYDFTGRILATKKYFSEFEVKWNNVIGANYTGNNLVWNSGSSGWKMHAASQNTLGAGVNGWVEFTARNNRYKVFGFAQEDTGLATVYQYAISHTYTGVSLIDNGQSINAGTYIPGDVFRIERSNGAVVFSKNGAILRVSPVQSSAALKLCARFFNAGTIFPGARSSFTSTINEVRQRFEYDQAGRLLRNWYSVNSEPEILLALNEYNELGQLVDKKLHSTVASGSNAKQSVDYRYNIRGWLTSMNNARLAAEPATNDDVNDLFGMELGYNNSLVGLGNTSLFNGNISGMAYSSYGNGPIKEKGYTYTYDAMNRLAGSVYKERTGSTLSVWDTPGNNAFAETGFSYDLNGNILTLTRNDRRTTGLMDALQYNYGTGTSASNQLLRVTDNGDDFRGFIDGTNTGNDYTYDANGNMTRDLNKGIGTSSTDNANRITYNFLNLPEVITKGGHNIRYVYDATGRKLCQVVSFGTQQKQTDYAGEFVFENDVLKFIIHEEGRIAMSTLKPVYANPGEGTTDFVAVNSTLAAITLNEGQKYVRVTSGSTTPRTGVFPVGGTVAVQPGERYTIRAKGYRTGTNPVHLLVRANGVDLNWPGATLPSLVANETWVEQTITIPVGATALQVGLVWNTVTAGEQFFVNDFEITKPETNTPEYQYHLKDHLGNVRLSFTSKEETKTETATYEPPAQNTEQSQFARYSTARLVNSSLFDRTNGTANGYAQRLNGSANERYGLAKSISVMPGDVIQAEVSAKYVDPVSSNWNGALATLMTQIAGGAAGVVVDGSAYATSTGSFPFAGLLSTNDTGAPRAYLNWLVFDRNYTFLTGGFRQISAVAKETGTDVAHELLAMPQPLTITQPGYVYIYLSNESPTTVEVYFDDFKVTHSKSPVIQGDEYYPFGLTFNSDSRENSVKNNYLYNGIERQDELDLGWDLAQFRSYDPTIARFMQIDPVIKEHESPYAWNTNNPMSFNDPLGADSTQRAQAVANSQTIVDANPEKSKYCYDPNGKKQAGAKGKGPGEAMDCSGMAVNWRKAGNEEVTVGSKDTEEKADELFKKTNGVAQLAATSEEVDKKNVVKGNEIYFNDYTHVGLVTEVVTDKAGNVVGYNVNHSSRSSGQHTSYIPKEGNKDYKIDSFRKWDTKPD